MNSELEKPAASRPAWTGVLLLAVCCILLAGCRTRQAKAGPFVEFTRVPLADEGGPDKLDVIEGRVVGAHTELQVVLFARSGAWYVQPFANQTFTQIQPDSRWRSATHLGTEYAVLLVEPGYEPPPVTDALPAEGGGVAAIAVVKGEAAFWQRWWFLLLCGLACTSALLAFYSYRLHRSARRLNMRFEERLAERTRVAQEVHDTLLQGVISASMQLHVAVDCLSDDLPARAPFAHVLSVLGQVVEESSEALRRLRSSAGEDSLDVEQAFSQIRQEFAAREQIDFRLTVEGRPRAVHPIIRDEVYRIGREAVVDALRHAHARRIEVEVEYKARRLRIVIRGDGYGMGPQAPRSKPAGQRDLSGMRRRAESIGARFSVRSRPGAGAVVELSVPGYVAFRGRPSKGMLRRLAGLYPLNARSGTTRPGKEESK
ncbi:MAG: sensor histidine kinase [Blastocatellia bacterium]